MDKKKKAKITENPSEQDNTFESISIPDDTSPQIQIHLTKEQSQDDSISLSKESQTEESQLTETINEESDQQTMSKSQSQRPSHISNSILEPSHHNSDSDSLDDQK